ncbi:MULTISPECIES: fkbH domain protein [unclassified Burkholderia]|uniref:fkbH domain protein n=1 Tax=unclassified Burkholderia TaxID=2613784 RepID=UPI00075F54DC|nr:MULTISPECIES: fkbH domain protein [unclassified Burkholderia]KVN10103.1 fkbH domain protein [Burkholderia sp. MSMB1552]KWZ50237.1 fkbH domain protein [Burkholderia sp. MSMB1588]
MSAGRLYVGATFNASPLDPLLRARGFGDVAFTRYNQLLQALLAPDPQHVDDATLLLVRLADFVRHEASDRTQSPDALAALLAQRAQAWLDALASFAAGRATPPRVVVLPSPALDARGAALARFFERLQLRIASIPFDDKIALAKSARLSHTAATFHLSGRPLLEADLLDTTSRDAAGLALTVADRFGQYGCSGFALVRVDAGLPVLADFVLSCTVLGKQVEHGVLLALAQAAQRAALPAVALDYARNDANQPAVDFVDAIAAQAGVAIDRSGPRARLRIAPSALAEAVLACAKAPQALAAAAQALDLWSKDVSLPPVEPGDFVALLNAGGYASSMSSNHCLRGQFRELALFGAAPH